MKRERIAVNEQGIDAEGNNFELAAEPWVVQAGLMINVPVTLIFSDGREVKTFQAKITPEGVKQISKQISEEAQHNG